MYPHRILMTPKDVQIFGQSSKEPDAHVLWEDFLPKVSAQNFRTTFAVNPELKVDIQHRREITISLKNKGMSMNLNCGFRRKNVRKSVLITVYVQ